MKRCKRDTFLVKRIDIVTLLPVVGSFILIIAGPISR